MIKRFYVRVLSGIVLPVMLSCGQQGNAGTKEVVGDSVGARQETAVAPQRQNDTLTLALVGDIMMGTIYPSMKLPANDGRNLFDDVKGLLRSADIAAGNLEGTVFDGPATTKKKGPNSYAFRTPAKYMYNLVDAGFDFVGVANNHASDFGEEGRQGTFRNLKDAGIAYAGRRGECEYAVVERNGMKVAFTQFGHNMGTLNLMNYDEVKRVVGEMRRNARHSGGIFPRRSRGESLYACAPQDGDGLRREPGRCGEICAYGDRCRCGCGVRSWASCAPCRRIIQG